MTTFSHIAILTLQAILLATLTVWLFRWRSRFGVGFFIAAMALGDFPEVRFSSLMAAEDAAVLGNFGGTLLFSVKLFAVLLLYVREDAIEARGLLYGIFAGSLMATLLVGSAGLHLLVSGNDATTWSNTLRFAGLHTFGMAILILDAIVLILAYEWIMQRGLNAWAGAVGALMLALSVDNAIFYTIYSRQEGFGHLLLQSFAGKWYAALVYGTAFALTLRWIGLDERTQRTRSIGDIYETLTFRQRFEALRRRTDFDALTGLKTRSLLEQEAAAALTQPGMTLAVIDIDFFKAINDRHGHLRGDAVLREVANRVLTTLPEGASGYRYGGEEFVVLGVLAPGLPEQLRAAVAAAACDGLAVTISIGVARADEAEGLAAVFALADARLYAAKGGGRNRVVGDRSHS